jgi:tRNA threonylcarbamoyladenosine biosynthesis protein TsaE
MEKQFDSVSLHDMAHVATWLSSYLSLGSVVFFEGPLGAGKTTLVQFLAKALGIKGNIVSPTFTIAKPYPLIQGTLVHIDAYRLSVDQDDQEWLEMCDDKTMCMIEWPSHLKNASSFKAITVRIDMLSLEKRRITVTMPGVE